MVYIVVTDGKGNRIASSSKEDVGKLFYEPQVLSGLGINDKSQWRSIPLPDEREVFEVYRTFSPLPNFQQHMLHTETPWDGCQDCPWGNRQSHQRLVATQGDDALLIFIGLDMKPFEAALAEDFRNTTITGIVVGLLALGGFMSLFWAQHYRLSRRILQDTNAFASEVVTSMPSGLITADKNGRISLVNSEASRLFGMPSER